MISAPIKKPNRQLTPLSVPPAKLFPIQIHTPPPRAGMYHRMALVCIGVDDAGLFLVPLPAIGDRPAYLGFFRPEHIIQLDPDEADYADF
ncbi:MAG: hypothetical protein HC860_18695 [Alkalinema sp. RU_4_3]|nr:hypothetical protein [Alkalinema sp. RU_4_3]NJR70447.1 hypothetical protein [Synechococcales cyanobacterium CRU_2_2]